MKKKSKKTKRLQKTLSIVMLGAIIGSTTTPLVANASEITNNVLKETKTEDITAYDTFTGRHSFGYPGDAYMWTDKDDWSGDDGLGDYRIYFKMGDRVNSNSASMEPFISTTSANGLDNVWLTMGSPNGFIQWIDSVSTSPTSKYSSLSQDKKDKIGITYSWAAKKVKETQDFNYLVGADLAISQLLGGDPIDSSPASAELKNIIAQAQQQMDYYNAPPSFMTSIDGNIELVWSETNSRYEAELTDTTGVFDDKWLDSFLAASGTDGFTIENPAGDNNILIYTTDPTAETTLNMTNDYMPEGGDFQVYGVTIKTTPIYATGHYAAGSSPDMVAGVTYEASLNPTITVKEAKGTGTFSNEGTKTDGSTEPIAGSTFDVKDSEGNVIETITTDASGNGTTSALIRGDYILVQTSVPGSYNLNETEYPFTISSDGEVVQINSGTPIPNNEIKGKISLHKVGATNQEEFNSSTYQPLEGVEFTVYDELGNTVEVLTTDSNGDAMSQELSAGTYTLEETGELEGYIDNTTTYTVIIDGSETDGIYDVSSSDIVNDMKSGTASLNKLGETDENYDTSLLNDIDTDTDTELETVMTINDGDTIIIGTDLDSGNYTLVNNSESDVTVTINGTDNVISIGESLDITFNDTDEVIVAGGNIDVMKEADINTDTDTNTDTEETVLYTLESGTYEVGSGLDIEPGTYNIRISDGAGTFSLNETDYVMDIDGEVSKIEDIEFNEGDEVTIDSGTFELTDQLEQKGFIASTFDFLNPFNSTPKVYTENTDGESEVVMTINDGETIVIGTDLNAGDYTLVNNGSTDITVTINGNDNTILAGESLAVTFNDTDEIIISGGNIDVMKEIDTDIDTDTDTELETVMTINDGDTIIIGTDLDSGNYTLVNNSESDVTVTINGTDNVISIGESLDITFNDTDEVIVAGGSIDVMKETDNSEITDLETAPLGGITFDIYADTNANETIDSDEVAVESITTSSDGSVTSNNLVYGNYVAKETVTAKGYILSDEEYPFSITEDGTNINISDKNIINILDRISITVTVEDNNGNPLNGVELSLGGINLITDTNGMAVFENMPYNTYTLEETATPEGFESAESVEVVVNDEVDSDNDKNIEVTITNQEITEESTCEDTDTCEEEVIDDTTDETVDESTDETVDETIEEDTKIEEDLATDTPEPEQKDEITEISNEVINEVLNTGKEYPVAAFITISAIIAISATSLYIFKFKK